MPTTEEIINVIQNYDDIRKDLNNRLIAVTKEYQHLDRNIYEYSTYRSTVYGSTGNTHSNHDLSDILQTLRNKRIEYNSELEDTISILLQQLEEIRRMRLCYMVLPYMEHEVLDRLYENHQLGKQVCVDLQISKRKLYRIRDQAIKMIQTAYGSELSNTEILQLQKLCSKKGTSWKKLMEKEQE